jgi:alkylated DNA repair dioxygenase AlkB
VNQNSLFHNPQEHHKVRDGSFLHIETFLNHQESAIYFEMLKNDINWQQEEMNMYGKELPFPRLTAWYADEGKTYSFSGLTLKPKPWTNSLLELKKRVEVKTNAKFNSVLLNRYRDGQDSISWHQDDEKDLGKDPVIASLNFGATSRFQLRHLRSKEKIDIALKHGSLLVMFGKLNQYWQHQVPKTKKAVGERINLTFRHIN